MDFSQLRQGVLEGNLARVRALIENIPSNTEYPPDDEGLTVVHHAAMYGEAGILEALLAHGSPCAAQKSTPRGASPLILAAGSHRTACCRVIIGRIPGTELATALRGSLAAAAQGGATPEDWAQAIAVAGAVGEASPTNTRSSLGSLATLSLLLRHGADPAEADAHGRTAAQIVAESNRGRVPGAASRAVWTADVAVTRAAASRQALAKGIEFPLDASLFAALVADEACDVNGRDYFGLAAVHKLVLWRRDTELRALLAARRVDLAATTPDGATALHLSAQVASAACTGAILAALCDSGSASFVPDDDARAACLRVEDTRGRTALDLALDGELPFFFFFSFFFFFFFFFF
jgi:ankyrin repeat protein